MENKTCQYGPIKTCHGENCRHCRKLSLRATVSLKRHDMFVVLWTKWKTTHIHKWYFDKDRVRTIFVKKKIPCRKTFHFTKIAK